MQQDKQIDNEKSKDIRQTNITAARAVADVVRTSLGPRGMDKMVSMTPTSCLIWISMCRSKTREVRLSSPMMAPLFWTKCPSFIQLLRCLSRSPRLKILRLEMEPHPSSLSPVPSWRPPKSSLTKEFIQLLSLMVTLLPSKKLSRSSKEWELQSTLTTEIS